MEEKEREKQAVAAALPSRDTDHSNQIIGETKDVSSAVQRNKIGKSLNSYQLTKKSHQEIEEQSKSML